MTVPPTLAGGVPDDRNSLEGPAEGFGMAGRHDPSRILDPQVRHDRYCLSDAASWVSVSWNALTAASRYWPIPVRPWIILLAPVWNWA